MRKTAYEKFYERLQELGCFLEAGTKGYLEFPCRESLMNLVCEKLSELSDGSVIYSLSHTYEQNGDLMRDPEMEIQVWHELQVAEPLTYRQDNLGIFQEVYQWEGSKKVAVNTKLKTELKSFLDQWLRNLKAQKFNFHKVM